MPATDPQATLRALPSARQEHHVTFIRDSDRTRLIFIMEGDLAACIHKALERAPHDFRMAAVKENHTGGPIRSDGDDYRG